MEALPDTFYRVRKLLKTKIRKVHVIYRFRPVAPVEAILFEGFDYIAACGDGVGIFAGFVKLACEDFAVTFADHGIFVGVDIDGQSLVMFGGGRIPSPGVSAQIMDRKFLFSIIDFSENLFYSGRNFFMNLKAHGFAVFFAGGIEIPDLYRYRGHILGCCLGGGVAFVAVGSEDTLAFAFVGLPFVAEGGHASAFGGRVGTVVVFAFYLAAGFDLEMIGFTAGKTAVCIGDGFAAGDGFHLFVGSVFAGGTIYHITVSAGDFGPFYRCLGGSCLLYRLDRRCVRCVFAFGLRRCGSKEKR